MKAVLTWLLAAIRQAPDPMDLLDSSDEVGDGDAIEIVFLGQRWRISVAEVADAAAV